MNTLDCLIEEEVRKIRKEQPKSGTEKVHILIKPFLLEHGIKTGRVVPTGNKLYELLRTYHLLPKRKKELLALRNPDTFIINTPTW